MKRKNTSKINRLKVSLQKKLLKISIFLEIKNFDIILVLERGTVMSKLERFAISAGKGVGKGALKAICKTALKQISLPCVLIVEGVELLSCIKDDDWFGAGCAGVSIALDIWTFGLFSTVK